ncbi:antitoxin MazE family protein [Achromobacter sp. ACM01]|uniref:antitoxin MazE family protein n=1 Tax=Achromobacter sp. ACM01 TaxID=2769298 RepID=UPI00177CB432|nr:antitoxin MazE family protein [Achromobacter sp. ACM01]MBD9475203.1 antitoxin MazE family protein [Achromobacter sp. ACM01]
MGTSIINAGAKKHRDARLMVGLRQVRIWVPDTRRPGFAEECQRQSLAVASSDNDDKQLKRLMDETDAEVDGWTE